MKPIELTDTVNRARFWSLMALRDALPDLQLKDSDVQTCGVKIRCTGVESSTRYMTLKGKCRDEEFLITTTMYWTFGVWKLTSIDVYVRDEHQEFREVYIDRLLAA